MPEFYLIESDIRRFYIDDEVSAWKLCDNLWFW